MVHPLNKKPSNLINFNFIKKGNVAI